MTLNHTQHGGFRLSNIVDRGTDFYKPHYCTDGYGRDSYILNNNGGLKSFYHTPSQQIKPSRFIFLGNNQLKQDRYSSTVSTTKNSNYNYNGTGRDSYIAHDNGGFYPGKTVAEYQNTFQEKLRVDRSKERESTVDYMNRRNRRVNKYQKNKSSISIVGNDHSPERHQQRAQLISKITKGGSGNDIFSENQGWITNKQYKNKRNEKELYQTVHSNFLSQPKLRQEKFASKIKYLDLSKDIKNITNPSDEYGDQNIVVAPLEVFKMSVSTKADKKSRRNLLNHAMAKSMMRGNFDSSIELMGTKSKLDFPRMSQSSLQTKETKPQTVSQLSSKLSSAAKVKKRRNLSKNYSSLFLNSQQIESMKMIKKMSVLEL